MGARAQGEQGSRGDFSLDGLDGAVEILVDRWGIPHIYATSAPDAWFAQGFNAARDRLWQLDTWRRAGLGRLAAVLGPDYVERDRAARLFLYRGSISEEWGAYGCDLQAVLRPFVDGVNARIEEVLARPELLPPEFSSLDYEPDLWSAEDVLRIRAHARYRNLRSEVARARMLHRYGRDTEALRSRLEPAKELTVPDGLDLSLIDSAILRSYDLAAGTPLSDQVNGGAEGSNNWVIAGERTASGRPLLANDPHRQLSLPSLRYLVHVSAPNLEFAGGGEPMLPGISFGHNGEIGFGLTVLPTDQEDLYVYELDDVAGDHYRYGSGWEPVEIERQMIQVRDAQPVQVELRFTRHGPVLDECADRNVAFALRAAWLGSGMAPYLGGLALIQARGWEGFREAARCWGAPGENLVYADRGGDIGWQAAGRAPVRPNWDGLLPVPGDGRYEWDGFVDPAELPHLVNPRQGWLATANDANVPRTGRLRLAYEWEPPFRQRRIAEVLARPEASSVEDSVQLQADFLCLAAVQVTPFLGKVVSADPRVARAVEILGEWDCRLDAESAPAAIFELWFRKHLRQALFASALAAEAPAGEVGRAVEDVLGDESVVRDARIDLDLIEAAAVAEPGRFASLLERTLGATMLELEQLLGERVAEWEWGSLHTAAFEHPLADWDPGLASLAPIARGGSCDTVGNTDYGADGFRQTVGASSRLVLDVGEWDRSVAMNAPGQAGDPSSPHYADLLAKWSRNESVPLLFSRAAVEEELEERIVLIGRTNSFA